MEISVSFPRKYPCSRLSFLLEISRCSVVLSGVFPVHPVRVLWRVLAMYPAELKRGENRKFPAP